MENRSDRTLCFFGGGGPDLELVIGEKAIFKRGNPSPKGYFESRDLS
jgi:hypothetical protein